MLDGEKRLAFISYGGSIDAKIANLLSEFLVDFFSYKGAVYCTASDDNRVSAPYGEDFSDSYMSNIMKSEVFIPLLSENYLHSTTTLVEMGAAYECLLLGIQKQMISDENIRKHIETITLR